jgi:hypothetical protein
VVPVLAVAAAASVVVVAALTVVAATAVVALVVAVASVTAETASAAVSGTAVEVPAVADVQTTSEDLLDGAALLLPLFHIFSLLLVLIQPIFAFLGAKHVCVHLQGAPYRIEISEPLSYFPVVCIRDLR